MATETTNNGSQAVESPQLEQTLKVWVKWHTAHSYQRATDKGTSFLYSRCF